MIIRGLTMKHLLRALFGLLAVVGVAVLPQLRSAPTPEPTAEALPTNPSTPGTPTAIPPAMTFIPPTGVPTLAETPQYAAYPNYGPAAELHDNVWLNTDSDQPLRLADLRGQVVLLEFWTFDCINCLHV